MSVYSKVYKQGTETLLAACDENVLGKTFEEGEVYLNVKESFYKGDTTDPTELKKRLKRATISNLVGEISVNTALKMKLANKKDVLYVEGVPHLQVIKMM